MDDLLRLELEYTKKMITDPSEINKENLLNLKIKIIHFLSKTEDANVKKVCNEFYEERKKKLYEKYNYFSNLMEYLKKKQDVTNIMNIIDSTVDELII